MTTAAKILWDFEDAGEFLLVDKPLDWSSFDAVKKIKVLFKVRRVGHAGTLDPKATGLLIVCTGRKTKTLDSFQLEEKEYSGSFEMGARTASFDSETQVFETREFAGISQEIMEQAITKFTGKIWQTPPMYSAAKFDGKPLYRYARKGKSVERPAKEIEIIDFRITKFSPPIVEFIVVCSKGTYIRTLVEDLGIELGCGCTLRSLRRTRIGSYRVEDAMSIEDLITLRQTLESRRPEQYEVSQPA
jgi:tRNA pseudouridine55 synthase